MFIICPAGIGELLSLLRWHSDEHFFSASQIQRLVQLLPEGHPSRCDMFVVLWARLVDEENLNLILDVD